MLFSKLILFLALQYFSFGKVIPNPLGDAPTFYNYKPVLRDNGTVLLTLEGSEPHNINDFPLLKVGENETLASFSLIEEEEFPTLKTTLQAGESLQNCDAIRYFYTQYFYQLLGYAAYVYGKKEIDIAPSVVYILETMPQKWYEDAVSVGGQPPEREIQNGVGCAAFYEAILYSFQLKGLVSDECVPNNDVVLPGKEGAPEETQLPVAPEICADSSQIEKHLTGFKIGRIQDGTVEYVKKFLTRFGPVRADIEYFKQGSAQPYDFTLGIIIGWDQDRWIIATAEIEQNIPSGVMSLGKIPFIREEGEQSLVYGNVVFFDLPEDVDPIPGGKDDDIPKGDDPDSVSVVHITWSIVVAVMVLPLVAILL